jgi:hypothetical protein
LGESSETILASIRRILGRPKIKAQQKISAIT